LGYRCDRLPFFVIRVTDIPLEHRADTPDEVAKAVAARTDLGIESALLVCNPISADRALADDEMLGATRECTQRAERQGIRGKAVTPFLLSCLAEVTEGRSLEANLSLLESNAGLAAQVAGALAGGR
jgi:pseudouridylate synthase